MNVLILSLTLTACLLSTCHSEKILMVSLLSSKSHYILARELSTPLADAGHDVTLVSGFSENYVPKNGSGRYKEIALHGAFEEMQSFRKVNFFEVANISPFVTFVMMNYMGSTIGELSLKHPKMQELIKSNEKFDVVIVEDFMNDCLKPLAEHFGAHLILFVPMRNTIWSNEAARNPSSPSYNPEIFLNYPNNMNFWQRTTNAIYNFLQVAINYIYIYPAHNKMVKKYISEELDLYDSINNQSLILVNTHTCVSTSLPTVPEMVFIGGYHVKPPKELPKDLQEYLDNSKEGVIVFSMGTFVQGRDMPREKRDQILSTFRQLKLNVLWKWEDDMLPGKPENVRISKWLPQNDLLGHPKVKLFITHCGYGSFTETIINGKPIVAIPILGDQMTNAFTAFELGIGVSLNYNDLDAGSFSAAVQEVLENPKYAENAKYISSLYKDRQVSPIEDAIYWIEYVIRHNGAKHLKLGYLDMPWYQYYLLDVTVFILSVTFGTVWIIKKIIYRKCKSDKLKKE